MSEIVRRTGVEPDIAVFDVHALGEREIKMRKIGKFMLLFAVVCVAAAASGYLSYTVTVKMMNEKQRAYEVSAANEERKAERVEESAEQSEPAASNAPVVTNAEYYMVRLEGEALGVYACDSEKEEFLYNERIYTSDLSEQDYETLEKGVRLENIAALTGFLENFTS